MRNRAQDTRAKQNFGKREKKRGKGGRRQYCFDIYYILYYSIYIYIYSIPLGRNDKARMIKLSWAKWSRNNNHQDHFFLSIERSCSRISTTFVQKETDDVNVRSNTTEPEWICVRACVTNGSVCVHIVSDEFIQTVWWMTSLCVFVACVAHCARTVSLMPRLLLCKRFTRSCGTR